MPAVPLPPPPAARKLNIMVKYNEREVEAVFSALANPTRRRILERLRTEAPSISELAEPFDMSLVAVSRHVHVLEEAGLVRLRRDGRSRFCHLEPGPLREGDRWLCQFRGFWEDELEQIDRFLTGSEEKGDRHAR